MMKLSNETVVILKNFAAINQGIEFKEGNVLSTISAGKTILARAELKDEFPEGFCIYDLNQFLSVLSLFKDVEIEFDTSNVIFKSDKSMVKYRKTAKEMIVSVPEKEIKLPSVEVSFVLKEFVYANIMKLANVLQSPNISVESDGDMVYLTAFNASDDSAHTNSVEVCEGNGNKFKMVFLVENLKMILGTYNVEISSKGLALFTNVTQDIKYWVATESKSSTYGV